MRIKKNKQNNTCIQRHSSWIINGEKLHRWICASSILRNKTKTIINRQVSVLEGAKILYLLKIDHMLWNPVNKKKTYRSKYLNIQYLVRAWITNPSGNSARTRREQCINTVCFYMAPYFIFNSFTQRLINEICVCFCCPC